MEEIMNEAVVDEEPTALERSAEPSNEVVDTELLAQAELLRQSYPDFDLAAQMEDPLFRGFVSGELRPNLRQIFELCNQSEITKRKVEAAVSEAVAEAVEHAVAEAVARTVAETEERMLSHIRARGQRPTESGLHAAQGVRTHPAVGRLTKADRERLARRASRGETIRF